jgi:hypothetical protein
VLRVLKQLIANGLLGRGRTVPELPHAVNNIGDAIESVKVIERHHVKGRACSHAHAGCDDSSGFPARGLRFMFATVSDDIARFKRHALMYALVSIAADAAAAMLVTSRQLWKRWAIPGGT